MLLAPSWLLPLLVASAAPSQAGPLDGVWRSLGYGFAIDIRGPDLQAYEVTETTCVKGFAARRDSAAAPGMEATFRTQDGQVLFVREGGTANRRIVHNDGSASDIRFDRLPAGLPAACRTLTPDTPADNFEVWARTWGEHYILFDQKRTDWNRVVEANRPKVSASTTPAELFDLLEAMIKPFDDAHTFLIAPSLKRTFRALRAGTDRAVNEWGGLAKFRSTGLPALVAVTNKAYLTGPLREWCNGQVQYGHVGASTGYLRILSFSGYAKGGFAEGMTALQAALDTVFSDRELERLVIDVRINFGGADPYGLEIASRLATGPYLAYVKEARAHPTERDRWTPGDSSIVRPSSRPGFKGPVVELIGPLSISAGETFTQALMGRTPKVVRIGEHTQGVFSDVLGRTLPNGWRFGLPNEVFRAPDGKTFDGPGIPPDVEVPVFAKSDVDAGRDPAMKRALDVLGKK
jgi:hypothetical protein